MGMVGNAVRRNSCTELLAFGTMLSRGRIGWLGLEGLKMRDKLIEWFVLPLVCLGILAVVTMIPRLVIMFYAGTL